MRTRFAMSILLGLSLFPASCADHSKPSRDEIVRTIEKQYGAIPLKPVEVSAGNSGVEIYFDASESMAGFLRLPSSGSRTQKYTVGNTAYSTFIAVIRTLFATQDNVRFSKFGRGDPTEIDPRDAVQALSFYSEPETKLATLIQGFRSPSDAASAQTVPTAILVITDGVESAPSEGDFLNVISAISRWLDKGLSFGIVALRSEFNGKAFSETLHARGEGQYIGWYSSSEHPNGGRPFYCYIFARDSDFPAKFYQQLKQALAERNKTGMLVGMIDFGRSPIARVDSTLEIPNKSFRGLRNSLVVHSTFNDPDTKLTVLKIGDGYEQSGVVRINMDIKTTTNLSNFAFDPQHLQTTGVGVTKGGTTGFAVELTPFGATRTSNSMTLLYALSPKQSLATGWSFVRLAVRPEDTFFVPPDWVRELSTESDDSLSSYSKTLGLFEMVNTLMKKAPAFTRAPLAVCYLAIRRS